MTNIQEIFLKFKKEQKELEGATLDSKVLIVDGLNQYMRCFAAFTTMDDNGEHIGGVVGLLMSLALTIRTLKPTRCVIVFDGRGGSQRRREIFKEYKENRKSMTRLNRTYGFNSIEEEKKSQSWQLKLLVKILEHLPVTMMALDQVEADDIIAYLAELNYSRGNKTIILSTDKDFLQLVNDKTTVYNPVKKREYDEQTVLDEYFIHPKNFLVYRSMDGDKSDGIPGVKGVGVKTLIKHFPRLLGSNLVTIEEIFKEAEQIDAKVCKSIVENEELIERNSKLMQLRDVDISGTIKLKALDMFDKKDVQQLNKFELTKLLRDTKLLGAIKNYDHWVLDAWGILNRYTLCR